MGNLVGCVCGGGIHWLRAWGGLVSLRRATDTTQFVLFPGGQRRAMYNDRNDDVTQWPKLSAERERVDDFMPREVVRSCRHGLLWMTLILMIGGCIGLGWWMQNAVQRLERQLVATQNSFSRISEENTSQVRELSSRVAALKVTAADTSVDGLQTRLQHLEQQLMGLSRGAPLLDSQQQLLETRQVAIHQQLEALVARLEALAEGSQAHQALLERLNQQMDQLEETQIKLQAVQDMEIQDRAQLTVQLEQLSQLARTDKTNFQRLEQDLLAIRSQLERLVPPPTNTKASISVQEFDLFRAQATRQITALQGQIANLQAQIDKR